MNPRKLCQLVINVDKDNHILQQQPNPVYREVMHRQLLHHLKPDHPINSIICFANIALKKE
jgi:hypothetical protein